MFKPGQSGNPGGRPKTKPLTEAVRAVLESSGFDDEPMSNLERLARSIVLRAMDSSTSDAKEIWNRLEGRVAEKIEIEETRPTPHAIPIQDPRFVAPARKSARKPVSKAKATKGTTPRRSGRNGKNVRGS